MGWRAAQHLPCWTCPALHPPPRAVCGKCLPQSHRILLHLLAPRRPPQPGEKIPWGWSCLVLLGYPLLLSGHCSQLRGAHVTQIS